MLLFPHVYKAGADPAYPSKQPIIPSAFSTAVLRLCFPTPSSSSTDLVVAGSSAPSTSTHRHPVAIVSYFLERGLVGDGQIEGGLVRHLAKAGDWVNFTLHAPFLMVREADD